MKLGPSALAGFSLFILMIPLQERVMAFQFQIRKKANIWTDQRAKIILEVLGWYTHHDVQSRSPLIVPQVLCVWSSISHTKYRSSAVRSVHCCNERQLKVANSIGIFDLRKFELHGIRKIQFARSAKSVSTASL